MEASGHHGFDVKAPERARENTLLVVRIEIQIDRGLIGMKITTRDESHSRKMKAQMEPRPVICYLAFLLIALRLSKPGSTRHGELTQSQG